MTDIISELPNHEGPLAHNDKVLCQSHYEAGRNQIIYKTYVSDPQLFEWWGEMIEFPVIAEIGLTPQLVEQLKICCDFLAFREEIWDADNPSKVLAHFFNEN